MLRRTVAICLIAVSAAACSSGAAATQSATKAPVTPAPTATAVPTATPTPKPTPTPTPEITAVPTPNLPAAPAGQQQLVSTVSNFAINLPSAWVFIAEDSALTTTEQVGTIKTAYPAIAGLIDSQTALLGESVKFVVFDPIGYKSGRIMTANFIVMPFTPPTDLKAMSAAYVTQIKTMYKLKSVASKTITLAAGPTIELDYTMGSGLSAMKLVQYIVFGEQHTYILTFGSNSGAWSKYQPLFLAAAKSLVEF
jgi:hypothetical protein